jgi:hypothetical protein
MAAPLISPVTASAVREMFSTAKVSFAMTTAKALSSATWAAAAEAPARAIRIATLPAMPRASRQWRVARIIPPPPR